MLPGSYALRDASVMADDDLAEVSAARHVVQSLARFGEGKRAIHDGPQLVIADGAVHGFEIGAAAHPDRMQRDPGKRDAGIRAKSVQRRSGEQADQADPAAGSNGSDGSCNGAGTPDLHGDIDAAA